MNRTVFTLAALMLGAASGAMGETKTQAREIPLAAVAGSARYSLAASPAIMLRGLDAASQTVLRDALSLGREVILDSVWSRVMAGALQVRREADLSADTLWFNPLLDSGLVVRWVREGQGWRVLAAAPVTGETIRGETPTDTLGWATTGEPLSVALRRSAALSFQTADGQSWNNLFALAPRAEKPLLHRAVLADLALQEFAASPGYGDSLAFVRELLVTDDLRTSKLPRALRQTLTEMGDNTRLSLRPITAFRLHDGWSVALQSPDAPGLVLFAHFADPPIGQPAIPTGFNLVGMDDTQQEVRP